MEFLFPSVQEKTSLVLTFSDGRKINIFTCGRQLSVAFHKRLKLRFLQQRDKDRGNPWTGKGHGGVVGRSVHIHVYFILRSHKM